MKFPYQPASDRVIIKPIYGEVNQRETLIAPKSIPKPQKGEVVAVGPGTLDMPMEVSVGDIAIFSKHHNRLLDVGGVNYYMVRQENILVWWSKTIVDSIKGLLQPPSQLFLGRHEVDSIGKLKALRDTCIIKPDPANDHIRMENGQMIYLDTSFEPEKHSVVKGTLVKNPMKLHPRSKTDIETMEGDRVIFHYSAINQAKNEGKIFYEKGNEKDLYIGVPYEMIFLAVRDKDVIILQWNI